MKPSIGVCLVDHEAAQPPHELAALAERCGLDAFFVPENSHVPLERPGTIRRFDGIERLARFQDPFATLGACAAVTSRITLGTGVCLMTQRDAYLTANAAASLDHLSGGRLVLGVAGGFIRESMEEFGSPFGQRWRIVRERVEAMKKIWSEHAPVYDGAFTVLDGMRCGGDAIARRADFPGSAEARNGRRSGHRKRGRCGDGVCVRPVEGGR